MRPVPSGSHSGRSAAVSGVSSALIALVGCPACWPAYVGLLSSLGLGVLLGAAVFVPLTFVLLFVALGSLAHGARRRREWKPLTLGVFGAAVVLHGRFAADADVVVLAGAGLLLSASIWNGLVPVTPACSGCPVVEK